MKDKENLIREGKELINTMGANHWHVNQQPPFLGEGKTITQVVFNHIKAVTLYLANEDKTKATYKEGDTIIWRWPITDSCGSNNNGNHLKLWDKSTIGQATETQKGWLLILTSQKYHPITVLDTDIEIATPLKKQDEVK